MALKFSTDEEHFMFESTTIINDYDHEDKITCHVTLEVREEYVFERFRINLNY